jgi:transposase
VLVSYNLGMRYCTTRASADAAGKVDLMTDQGEDCVVVNPSSMPKRSGDRIKTDRLRPAAAAHAGVARRRW